MYFTVGKLKSIASLSEMFFCSARDERRVVVPNASMYASPNAELELSTLGEGA